MVEWWNAEKARPGLATSGHLRIIAYMLGARGRVPGWTIRGVGTVPFGVLEMRCGARRCDLDELSKSWPPSLQIFSLQEHVCLVQPFAGPNARLVPVLLPSSQRGPQLTLHTPTHTHPHPRTRTRTRTRTRSARRRTPYSVRSPIPDQEAKLLGVSHARPPPPPSLRSLARCHPAPALGKLN